ncbi:MAG: hypothetical protein GSR80_001325, partial [Desulfurococcales archaeon]|nr:hypothetical protein [Desulfurococcales archaeon]
LGARLSGYEELELDVEEAFESAVRLLVDEGAEAIVISGDVFDSYKPSNRAIRRALSVLSWAAGEKGVPVVVAMGDHDYPQRNDHSPIHILTHASGRVYVPPESYPRSYTALDIVRASTVDLGGARFVVMPFIKGSPERRRRLTGALLEAASRLCRGLERPRVLVAHYGLDGYTLQEDAVASPAELPPCEYAALGHVHRRHIVRGVPIEGGTTTMAYPSSLVPLRLDEVRRHLEGERRGPLLVDLSGDEPVIHELEFKQPRIQAYLEARPATRRGLIEEARRALLKAGWRGSSRPGREPVLHLVLEMPRSTPLTPRDAVEAIRSHLRVKVRLAKVRTPAPRPEAAPQAAGDGGDAEVEVIRSLLDPRNRYPERARELARLIVEIKAAAARGDAEEAARLVAEALSDRFAAVWDESLGGASGIKRWLGG